MPTVSVVLPTYNAAPWLPAAIDSVLEQSLGDLELIVVDDGSTDATAQLLAGYTDTRLRVVRQQTNHGLVASLNLGLGLAAGRYIARMDADDVCHRRRLERQVRFLEKNEDIGVCGTWYRMSGGGLIRGVRPPISHEDICATLFFRSAFGHPTVMFRRQLIEVTGLRYDGAARDAEDFDLWVRARAHTRFANLPEYLLSYRLHGKQVSNRNATGQDEAAGRVRLSQLALLMPQASEGEKALHLRVCDRHEFTSLPELLEAGTWLDHLQAAHRRRPLFAPRAFGRALAVAWAHCCRRAAIGRGALFHAYLGRRYAVLDMRTMLQHAAFVYRTMVNR
jgi:glycosyltransferase involved in cell wall biosynthesis